MNFFSNIPSCHLDLVSFAYAQISRINFRRFEMIGVLSTLDNPMLPGYLANLASLGVSDYCVICDSRCLSSNQRKLLLDRLGGWSPTKHFNYNLSKDSWSTPFYFVESHNSAETISLIKSLNCTFLLNAGTPRKLNATLLSSTKYGVLNVHPGMLPNYRGKNCPEWAVYNNDSVIVTAHIMSIEYDEGDVLGTTEVDWRALPSYIEFRKQVYLASFQLASSVSLSLSLDQYLPLYNSNDSGAQSGLHDAMDDQTMHVVKGRFSIPDL